MLENLPHIIIILIVINAIFSKQAQDFHSHWSTMINHFDYSTLEFYELLVTKLEEHKIKGLKTENITLREGHILTPRRIYLRITWREFEYNVCCAKFSDATFFSSWLILKKKPFESFFAKIPFIGSWIVNNFFPDTFFKRDTNNMYMTYVHDSIIAVIEEITKETGTRLSELQRTPTMRNLFER